MKKSSSLLILILVVGLGTVATYSIVKEIRNAKESVPPAVDLSTFETQQKNGSSSMHATQQTLPTELNLAMTFYPQAPFGDWGMPWQEACEEASILLVSDAYYHHNWTREQFRDQILALVDWENKIFGDYKNTNAKQIAQMLHDDLGLKSVIHSNPTFEDVQKILAQGHLIVMPFAGRLIGNPFYTNGGPDYHVMVIKGYKTGQKVITEDVGTSHGEDYVYPWATLQNANHDYMVPIQNGAKVMIEVLPPSIGF